jgi:glucosylceramidase
VVSPAGQPSALTLFASPWSAPAWMKTNGAMKGGGRLKGPFGGAYYQAWAQYYRRHFF